jgi:hypothetical protein
VAGDLDAVLSDYAPDAIAATPDGIGSGHNYIRAIYERLLPLVTSTEMTSSIEVLGDVLYLTLRAHRNGSRRWPFRTKAAPPGDRHRRIPARARRQVSARPSSATCFSPFAQPVASPATPAS